MKQWDIRDKIALEAMKAIIRKSEPITAPRSEQTVRCEIIARGAYAYADSMIKVREEE